MLEKSHQSAAKAKPMNASRDVKRESPAVIYGVNPLMEVMRDNPGTLLKIAVVPGKRSEQITKILGEAARLSIPVTEVDRSRLRRLAGSENHQGIVGTMRPYVYAELEALLKKPASPLKGQIIVVLDSITDPQNLGAIIRTAHCFGASGVIIPQDRAAAVTPAVIKASAGAVQYLPVARVTNLSRTIEIMKEAGFWIYGAEACSGGDVRAAMFVDKMVLVMGSEGKGIRELIKKKCDFFLSIPMIGRIGSLNVSVAMGIILHDMFRGLLDKGDSDG